MSYRLIAASHLDMKFSKQLDISVQTIQETVNCCLIILKVLVHETKIEVDGRNVWVVLSAENLKDVESSVHVAKSLAKVTTGVIVECEI